MTYPSRNCKECKDILDPRDSDLCNRCLMNMIRAQRPAFMNVMKK